MNVILSLLNNIICGTRFIILNLVDLIEAFELRWSLWPGNIVKIIIIVTIHKCHLNLRFTGRLQLFPRIRWFLRRPQSYLADCVWRRYLWSVISWMIVIHDLHRVLFGLDLHVVRHLRSSDIFVFRVRNLSIVVAVCSWIMIVILFFVHCLLFSKYLNVTKIYKNYKMPKIWWNFI